jgi:hypothetical protein
VTEVAVIVPVLGRAQAAQPLADSLAAATTVSHRLVFVCSPYDDAEIAACRRTGGDVLVADWQPGRGDFARKVNLAYRETDEPYLFQAADDVAFHAQWDVEALAAITDGDRYGICGTDDGANPTVRRGRHSTHSLIARWYVDECGASYDGPGSVFSEAYDHQCVDVELVELAKARGCFTFAAGSLVEHRHPIWRTADSDATYRKGAARAAQDRRLYAQRRQAWERAAA